MFVVAEEISKDAQSVGSYLFRILATVVEKSCSLSCLYSEVCDVEQPVKNLLISEVLSHLLKSIPEDLLWNPEDSYLEQQLLP